MLNMSSVDYYFVSFSLIISQSFPLSHDHYQRKSSHVRIWTCLTLGTHPAKKTYIIYLDPRKQNPNTFTKPTSTSPSPPCVQEQHPWRSRQLTTIHPKEKPKMS